MIVDNHLKTIAPTTTTKTPAPAAAATAAKTSTTATEPPGSRIADTAAVATVGLNLLKGALDNTSGDSVYSSDNAEPNSAVERPQGITTFVDGEDTLQDLAIATTSAVSRGLGLGQHQRSTDSVEQIMGRPTFLANVTWSTTHTIGQTLAAYTLPRDILNASTIKTCKAQYNQYMKADIVLRIEASPVQFQAGRLWICFEPYATERGSRAVWSYQQQYTALHGIAYDPCKPNPVELRIPFASILGAWDMPMGQYGLGVVYLFVMSPLNSASTTSTVTVSIQGWFENVALSVPTQTAMATTPFGRRAAELTHGEPMSFQSSEQGLAQSHKFSTTLSRIGRIATALGNFPLLSSVATPVAHFANMASSFAAYFGFSKPADVSAPTKIIQHNRSAWTNSDGPLPLVVLGDSTQNAVDQTDRYFPNPIDEMDISYICSNPVITNQWSWATSATVGQLITVLPVHPGLCNILSNAGTYTFDTFVPTPMAYVASMFKYWAGSIKFRMEAVSTPFHAGRLMICYVPDYDPLAAAISINDVGNNYSVLWDITDSSQIEFEVPYMANTPYLDVYLDDAAFTNLKGTETGLVPRNRIRKIQNGAIVVFVLNQLVTPSSAASTISIINWVGGGQDLTFAEPAIGAFKPATGNSVRIDYTGKWYDGTDMTAVPSSVVPTLRDDPMEELVDRLNELKVSEDDFGFESHDEVDCPLRFQSAARGLVSRGPDQRAGTTAQVQPYANFIPPKYLDPVERAKMSFGEPITNLRKLTRRLTPAYALYPQNVTTAGAWGANATPPSGQHVLCFDPDYFGTPDGQDDPAIYNKQIAPVVPGQTNWLTELDSALSYISYLYAFSRGSRVYGVSARPNDKINGAPFAKLSDEINMRGDAATFDMRLSHIIEEDTPPRQPWFRPDDNLLGYNYANTTAGSLSGQNYSYGMNSYLLPNHAVEKSGEAGCGLVVQVPPTSKYPIKLITTSSATEANYVANNKYTAPRARRFLELRYRPFANSQSGTTSNFEQDIWPFPMTIFEAAADDHSFGGLVPPPPITRVKYNVIIPNYATGSKASL
ncbi:hypothetical protein 2 [Changjiang picorna-like virus 14]|uniref:hypothetical protein 2 n=1 Tax=Changjiang picorna-like virus 14 TaxID=1922787 RepID=UPI00090A7A49|nr:hypothetical protein 2 [Changjiang picorna-like virus 14]APG78997.1 hypothetical protein 2 [Changjiang picorna-like virus 14]